MSDPHFNLFYSYGRGSQKDPDRISQLEDNVTRGLLIVLKHLNPNQQQMFLLKLLKENGIKKDQLKNLSFDLQNIDDKEELNTIQKRRNLQRILLVISREPSDVNQDDIIDIGNNENIKVILSDDKKNSEGEKIIRIIKTQFGNLKYDEDECKPIPELGNRIFKRKQLASLIDALGDCRPDGWIYNDEVVILIESKIATNKVTEHQLYRHIAGHHGFNTQKIKLVKIIEKTWNEVTKSIETIKPINAIEKEITQSFLEYLAMTGERFSFEHIINGKATKEDRKVQLEFLVDRIRKKVPSLQPERKAQVRHVWQQLGPNNIHFSVYVWDNLIAIDLAIMEDGQKK